MGSATGSGAVGGRWPWTLSPSLTPCAWAASALAGAPTTESGCAIGTVWAGRSRGGSAACLWCAHGPLHRDLHPLPSPISPSLAGASAQGCGGDMHPARASSGACRCRGSPGLPPSHTPLCRVGAAPAAPSPAIEIVSPGGSSGPINRACVRRAEVQHNGELLCSPCHARHPPAPPCSGRTPSTPSLVPTL